MDVTVVTDSLTARSNPHLSRAFVKYLSGLAEVSVVPANSKPFAKKNPGTDFCKKNVRFRLAVWFSAEVLVRRGWRTDEGSSWSPRFVLYDIVALNFSASVTCPWRRLHVGGRRWVD